MNETGLYIKRDNMNAVQLLVKRLLDIVLAIVGLVLLSPLYLIIYLLLRQKGKGSPFFSQERIGKDGVPFMIYKFRTITEMPDAEPTLRAEVDDDTSTPLQKTLRRYHLDELPQLWNVLKGDMSFVGPRPERRYFIDKIMERSADYNLVLEMRPGITSEASIYNGYTDTIEKMLKRMELDIRYLENRTLWLDITIIFDTIYSIVWHRGN